MRVLLMEDDESKGKSIYNYLKTQINDVEIVFKKSYQSGLEEMIKNYFDCLLLDMTMPMFDITENNSSSSYNNFSGRDVLYEMDRREIHLKTIVITQFGTFGEGNNSIDAMDLDKNLEVLFPENYIGMVKYSSSLSQWKDELMNLLKIVKRID